MQLILVLVSASQQDFLSPSGHSLQCAHWGSRSGLSIPDVLIVTSAPQSLTTLPESRSEGTFSLNSIQVFVCPCPQYLFASTAPPLSLDTQQLFCQLIQRLTHISSANAFSFCSFSEPNNGLLGAIPFVNWQDSNYKSFRPWP